MHIYVRTYIHAYGSLAMVGSGLGSGLDLVTIITVSQPSQGQDTLKNYRNDGPLRTAYGDGYGCWEYPSSPEGGVGR